MRQKQACLRKTSQQHFKEFAKQWELQLMVIPWILFLAVFAYIPMYGLIMAFQEYDLGDIIGFSRWVGLQHFQMFLQTPELFKIIRNTVVISLLKITAGLSCAIILAVMINEVRFRFFKRFAQTITYLPHFISWVIVSGLVFDFLSISGVANEILMSLGLIKDPVLFLGKPQYFWAIVVMSDLWKELGWNTILFIAAIASLDPQLYESAEIDGAGRFKKMRHITIAGIKPTIVIVLILLLGNVLNAGFEQILLLTNNMANTLVSDVSEIIDTYVYRMGLQNGRFSYASAVGIIKSVINLFLLVLANKASDRLTQVSLY